VSFTAGGVLLGSTPVATAAGVTTATIDTTDLQVGSQPVTATYDGDVLFSPSSSPVDAVTVQPDNPDVTIAATPANAAPGQQANYTRAGARSAPPGLHHRAGAPHRPGGGGSHWHLVAARRREPGHGLSVADPLVDRPA